MVHHFCMVSLQWDLQLQPLGSMLQLAAQSADFGCLAGLDQQCVISASTYLPSGQWPLQWNPVEVLILCNI